MKKYLFILLSLALVLGSCSVGRTTETKGVETKSYIYFVSNNTGKYRGGVEVVIDNEAPFVSKVEKDGPHKIKGDIYSIKTGQSSIKVYNKDELIYSKNVYIGNQETKKIELP